MSNSWEGRLERWVAAGIVEPEVAVRIRTWEAQHPEPQAQRWPVRLALAFGVILIGAGVLLFVSAHWDQMAAAERMALVVSMVAVFHVGGAFAAERFEALSVSLHTVGTIALGAAIALAGQIFNISEHWPNAILMWAAGAALGWLLLRHWTQAALVAILIPYWLAGEWFTQMESRANYFLPVSVGACALSFTYLAARRGRDDSPLRKALAWIGGLALIPAALAISVETWSTTPPWGMLAVAWSIALGLPLGLAFLLRGRDAVWNGGAILWALLLMAANGGHGGRLIVYFWCAVGSVALATWGTIEARAERINLGILGFAVTVLVFYFSTVMDKLGRSASLMLIGLLFLGGGWLLERTRRRLISHIQTEAI